MTRPLLLALAFALAFAAAPALAAEEAPPAEETSEKWGVNIDLSFSTLYIFRGLNLFQQSSNRDPHLGLFAAGTWEIFDTGFSIGVFGAYQLNGNVQENIDNAMGAEQDLIISYSRDLTTNLNLTASFIWYYYPFADYDQVGGSVPSYLEPNIGLTWAKCCVDLGLQVAYVAGVQDALADSRHIYIAPQVAKSIDLEGKGTFDLGASLGFKLFTQGELTRDNSYDLLLSASATLKLGAGAYIKPSANVGWTNFADLGLTEEMLFWFGLSVGYDL